MNKFTIILILALTVTVMAASEGPNDPTAAEDGEDWADPTNVYASDDARAHNSQDSGDRVILRAYTFGFSIPEATIDGIVVEIEGYGNEANPDRRDIDVALGIDGYNASGPWKEGQLVYTVGAEDYISLGDVDDTWESGLDYEQINGEDFGILVKDNDTAYGDHYIDHIRVTVYYTEAGAAATTNRRLTLLRSE